MGSSPSNYRQQQPNSFGISIPIDNKPFETAIDTINNTGILGMLNLNPAQQLMTNLINNNISEEEKKKQIINGILNK